MYLANRFIATISNKAPKLVNPLNPGASNEEFIHLEQLIGATLPTDFKDFYCTCNGGEGLFEAEELLSITRIADEYKIWQDLRDKGEFTGITSAPAEGIKDDWWNPLWIPITYDGFGNHYCLDLDPSPTGLWGQVIRFWHDDAERYVKAPNFSQFIESYLEAIDKDELVYKEDYGGFIDPAYSDD